MTYYLAIYNLETHEVEFEEKQTAKTVPAYWDKSAEEYIHERADQFAVDCLQRGGGKWKVYLSDKEPFSWKSVTPPAPAKKEKA